MNKFASWLPIQRQPATDQDVDPNPTRYRYLAPILLVALLHGLIYLFLVPPWQHYDELGHFEYVWLTAHRAPIIERLPQPGDFHPRLSYRVIESMRENGYFNYLGATPEQPPLSKDLHIPGYAQLGEPPLYYWLAGLPGRLFRPMALLRQLYAARMVSLLFYLATVFAGWGAARTLAPAGHPLRWLAPLVMALLPGLAELMAAVNNDALAIAVVTLFLWGCLRLIRGGVRLLELTWVLVTAAITVFVKSTAMIALLVLPVVLLFAVLRRRLRPLAWGVIAVGLLLAMLLTITRDDAAGWYRGTSQVAALRRSQDEVVHGGSLLALDLSAGDVKTRLPLVYQVIPPQEARSIFGQVVTFGAWMWSDVPGEASTPLLKAGQAVFSETVQLETAPQFFAFQAQLPADKDRIWVYLNPGGVGDRTIFYDGLVLAVGEHPLNIAPRFSEGAGADPGAGGDWGDHVFENLLRNPSFEAAGVRIRPWLDEPGMRLLPDNARPSQVIASMLDYRGAGYVYRMFAENLFNTFWARFGWGHVPLAWSWAYWIPGIITLIALVGCVAAVIRSPRSIPWDIVFVLLLVAAISWVLALTRGVVYLAVAGYYFPPARYIYPAVLPVALALASGWLQLPGRREIGKVALPLLLTALCLISFYSVALFYGRI